MLDPLENGLFDIPDYDRIEDEAFPPLHPPMSPGQEGNDGDPFANGDEEGEVSKLPEVPKRRGVKRPQPKLDSQRLTSERGLPALRNLFDNVRFKGKGHEADDLRVLMQRMENWAHRLYPKLQFEDFIDKVESLGAKKDVQTCLKRIRLDMPLTHEDFIGNDIQDEPQEDRVPDVPDDPFDEIVFPEGPVIHSTPAPTPVSLSEEQRRRIELNKQLALERRLARMQQQQQQQQGDSQLEVCGEVEGPSTSASTQANATQEQELKKEPEQARDAEQEKDTISSDQDDMVAPKETFPPQDSPLFDAEGDSPPPKLTNGIVEDDSD